MVGKIQLNNASLLIDFLGGTTADTIIVKDKELALCNRPRQRSCQGSLIISEFDGRGLPPSLGHKV